MKMAILLFGRHAPDCVADVVGNQQPSLLDRWPSRSAVSQAWSFGINKTYQGILRHSIGMTVLEGNEYHLIAGKLIAVPTAVFSVESAAT